MTNQKSWNELIAGEGLPGDFEHIVAAFYRPLAAALAQCRHRQSRPLVVGINGAQGTGKSTLALFLKAMLAQEHGLAATVISLDDLYLSRREREQLAANVHPLLAVRGVPGTHDVALGCRIVDGLLAAGPDTRVTIPAFDKAVDDRRPESEWPVVSGRPDVIVLEGWCLGAKPQPESALAEPVNALERERDLDGRWRAFVNHCLDNEYTDFFERIDRLVMLRAPGWDQVYHWRLLQEDKLRQRCLEQGLSASKVMSPEQVETFIAHYERLTRHQLSEMPARADAVLNLDPAHRITAMTGPLLTD